MREGNYIMEKYYKGTYVGERALFALEDAEIDNCTFEDGESPLKESKNIKVNNSTFRWKYPMWYSTNMVVNDSLLEETARSGIWYTKNITMNNCQINAPKTFRRSSDIVLNNCSLPNALETLWGCNNIKLNKITAKGDYFGMNSDNLEIDGLVLDGNYCFDGSKNLVIRNSKLNSKDSFWNTENVTVIDSIINGEYLAWNSKNITFINCKIISHQGLCYIDGLKMINCQLVYSDLCFEYCSNIDAEITTVVDSIKNPYSGKIIVKGVKELILEDKFIDKSKTEIIINNHE